MNEDRKHHPRVAFGRDYFQIVPERAALLVIDMQNSFVADGAVFQSPDGLRIIPNVNQLVARCRRSQIPVIWTQSDHSWPGGGLILDKHPVIRRSRELWLGDPSMDLYPDMTQPAAGEHRIVKHKYDAFHDTDLDTALRNLQRDTLFITGVATEVCCESTTRAAFFHDYKVVFLRDATGAFDPAIQDATCDRMDTFYARAMYTKELLAILEIGGEP